jgi:molybdate transport system regulatory protein
MTAFADENKLQQGGMIMRPQARAKIWIEAGGEKIFGDGPWDLLKRVERTGSLRQAAAEIKMSYSQAWRLIRMIEKKLGYSLLEKQTGGSGGGYSKLTAAASDLTCAYDHFRQGTEKAIKELFTMHLVNNLRR